MSWWDSHHLGEIPYANLRKLLAPVRDVVTASTSPMGGATRHLLGTEPSLDHDLREMGLDPVGLRLCLIG